MIVVTGVGRSGTSAVARVLHEELDVPMGLPDTLETEPSRACPDGSYEDRAIRELHQRAGREREVRKRLRNRLLDLLLDRRDELGEPFGVKDPRILDFPEAWQGLVDDALVYCHRDTPEVIESWVRVSAASKDEARSRVRSRLRKLGVLLDEVPAEIVTPIDMNEYRENDWIVDHLRAHGVV